MTFSEFRRHCERRDSRILDCSGTSGSQNYPAFGSILAKWQQMTSNN
ncbi:hypothetical protein [Tatumella citrea]|nr:hypothetical protein [Tatumella citrea]